jgi:hypothetical protein
MNNQNCLHRKAVTALSALLISCFATSTASAQNGSLSCKRDFAQKGDSMSAIRQKCGEPVSKDSFCRKPEPADQPFTAQVPGSRPNIVINANRCLQVEEWTYKPGSGQFISLLRFENGMLCRSHSLTFPNPES